VSYLLDTNTCIEFLRGRKPQIASRMAAARREDLVLCAVVKAELYFGAHLSAQSQRSPSPIGRCWLPTTPRNSPASRRW